MKSQHKGALPDIDNGAEIVRYVRWLPKEEIVSAFEAAGSEMGLLAYSLHWCFAFCVTVKQDSIYPGAVSDCFAYAKEI